MPRYEFGHGLVHRSLDLRGAEGAVLRHIVGKGDVIAHLLRVLDGDLISQRPHRVIVAGGEDGVLDLRCGDGAVVHEDVQIHRSVAGAVRHHVGNLGTDLLGKVDIPAFGSGAAVSVLTGAHQLVEFIVGGLVRTVVAGGEVFAALTVVEQVNEGVDLSFRVAVADRSGGLAADLHVGIGRADGHIGVRDRLPCQRSAGIGDARTRRNEDRRGLCLGDVEALGADRRLCRRTLRDVEQLGQRVQVFALGAAGNVLIAGVIVQPALLDHHGGHELNKQLFRAGGLHADAGDFFVNGDQKRLHRFGVGGNELIFRISLTH